MPTPLRILILEDCPDDAELMLHALRQAGYEPDWQRVETEPDYVSRLDPSLDIILADYALPQFDAIHALRLLRERGLDIPFIVVTSSISEEEAVESIKEGAADYLLKDRLARLGPAVVQAVQEKRLRDEKRRAEERLTKMSECFLGFGTDPHENMNHLTVLCGELMGAAFALYNRLDRGRLCSWGQWNTPSDYNHLDKPNGHVCYDVIQRGDAQPLVVRNLPETPYAQTDPNVLLYNLQTYVGVAVKLGGACVGSLCVVYQEDFVPSEEDKKLMGIIASAMGIEERRYSAEEALHRRDAILEAVSFAAERFLT
ncbi:MAG: response regulator, partial [Spirochaetota bacterium]